jgi:hypothetical protein
MFSSTITIVTSSIHPHLLHSVILFIFSFGGGSSILLLSPSPTLLTPLPVPPNARQPFSLVNINYIRTYNRNHYIEAFQNTSRLCNIAIITGLLGLSIGIVTTKFGYDSIVKAHRQVQTQEINTSEMMCQNDLEDVAQSIMSRETYKAKWTMK